MTGLFFELGPSSIGKNIKPIYNAYSWNSNASVIFLDQPVNVGYSYSGNSVSDTDAAARMSMLSLPCSSSNSPNTLSRTSTSLVSHTLVTTFLLRF